MRKWSVCVRIITFELNDPFFDLDIWHAVSVCQRPNFKVKVTGLKDQGHRRKNVARDLYSSRRDLQSGISNLFLINW